MSSNERNKNKEKRLKRIKEKYVAAMNVKRKEEIGDITITNITKKKKENTFFGTKLLKGFIMLFVSLQMMLPVSAQQAVKPDLHQMVTQQISERGIEVEALNDEEYKLIYETTENDILAEMDEQTKSMLGDATLTQDELKEAIEESMPNSPPSETKEYEQTHEIPESVKDSIVGYVEVDGIKRAIRSNATREDLQAHMQVLEDYNEYKKMERSSDILSFEAFSNRSRAVGNSSGMLTWNGVYSTPRIWIDGVGDVYCIQPFDAFPSGDWYDAGTWIDDDGWKAILMWGFPRNHGGQHGLTDDDAYLRTFVALNAYIGTINRTTVESYADSYVNMLLAKADSKDIPNTTYDINPPSNRESHFNNVAKRLETDPFHITGGSGTFWLEDVTNGFYMVDMQGNKVNTLPIGSQFRLVTENLGFNGRIDFKVKTDIKPMGAIKFQSPGVQDVVALKNRDPLPAKATHAIFKAAVFDVEGVKKDNLGSFLYNIEFTLFEDEALTTPAKNIDDDVLIVRTNNVGHFEMKKIVVGTYYLAETNSPAHVHKIDPIKIDGTQYAGGIKYLEITDVIKEFEQYEFNKFYTKNDGTKDPLIVTFEIYNNKGELVDTVVTNALGQGRTKKLPSNDKDDNKITYYYNEYGQDTMIPLTNVNLIPNPDNDGLTVLQVENMPKKPSFIIHKIVEDNPLNVTSDGSEWGIYNEQDELLEKTIIAGNVGKIDTLNFEDLGEDISKNYWKEISTSHTGLVLDTNKYYLPAVEWKDIEDAQEIRVEGNTEQTPIINRFKHLSIDGYKVDEYLKPLSGIPFGLNSVDTEDSDGNIIKTEVEEMMTDIRGYFQSSSYPIYMFNGVDLSYIIEKETDNDKVLLTETIDVPVISEADYTNYENGDIVSLSTSNDPLINYTLRLNVEAWKQNENENGTFKPSPNTLYGIFDKNKRQLATVLTDIDGKFVFENVNIKLFLNEDYPKSEKSQTYVGELKTANDNIFELDKNAYYLPNLQKELDAGTLEMDQIISLNTKETSYKNYRKPEKLITTGERWGDVGIMLGISIIAIGAVLFARGKAKIKKISKLPSVLLALIIGLTGLSTGIVLKAEMNIVPKTMIMQTGSLALGAIDESHDPLSKIDPIDRQNSSDGSATVSKPQLPPQANVTATSNTKEMLAINDIEDWENSSDELLSSTGENTLEVIVVSIFTFIASLFLIIFRKKKSR